MNHNKMIVQEDDTTYIGVTPADFPLSRTLLQGGHETGVIISGSKCTPWQWHGFKEIDGYRYISTSQVALRPLMTIFKMAEQEALDILSRLAHAISILPEASVLTAFFSTDSIYLTENDGFLFLPPSICDFMEASRTDEQLFEQKVQWSNPKYYHQEAVTYELTTIAYALFHDGQSPVAESRVRQDAYQAVPIELYLPQTAGKISQFFADRLSRNSKIDENLHSWINAFDTIKDIERGISSKEVTSDLEQFIEKQTKRATRKESLRIHKARNMVLMTVAVLIIGFFYTFIARALEPPLTAGMDALEVVEFYYAGYNNLDSISMADALAKGVNNPVEKTLTYLHVTTSVRQAYEFDSGFIPASEWVASGMPDLDENSLVYGVSDLSFSWVDDDTIKADYLLWNPVYADEETMKRETPAIATHVLEELDMAMKGDYWEITEIREISSEAVQ